MFHDHTDFEYEKSEIQLVLQISHTQIPAVIIKQSFF